jgi:hypothetical protein
MGVNEGTRREQPEVYRLPTIAQVADHLERVTTVSHDDCPWCESGD